MTTDRPRVLLLWPYGIEGAESIPMCMSFLEPQAVKVADVEIIDCSLFNLHPDSDKFGERVRAARPDIIGISSWSQNWRWVQRTIKRLRDLWPNAPIVLGGPHVTATDDTGLADYALVGEAEYTFPELITALARKAPAAEIESIQGLRAFGQATVTKQALIKDLDGLGLPNFDAMLLRQYQDKTYRYRNGAARQAPVLATRGCPYECSFCIEEHQPVLMADGDMRSIRDVSVGDMVLGYDEQALKFVPARVQAVHANGWRETVVVNTVNVSTGDKSLRCTPDHRLLTWCGPVLTYPPAWTQAGQLDDGYYVKNYHNVWEKVKGVDPSEPAEVYDLTTETHNYVATGLLVHNCEAPMLSGRKIRKHSAVYLRELLLHLRGAFDVSHVNIVDDNFSFYPDYAIAFCEMVLATPELAGMTFATPNGLRVERSNPEMFRAMKAAGWARVIFAPESGSQRMVDIMAKHLDLSVVPGRVEMAHAAGLEVEAFFIMNYPGETDDDVAETAEFIRTTPFDKISLHIFKPLPHTPIWRELVEVGKLAPDYVVGRYDEVDWLANGRTQQDIETMIMRYRYYARDIERIA